MKDEMFSQGMLSQEWRVNAIKKWVNLYRKDHPSRQPILDLADEVLQSESKRDSEWKEDQLFSMYHSIGGTMRK